MDISDELKEAIAAYQSIEKAKTYLKELRWRILEEEKLLQELEEEMNREAKDVEELKKPKLKHLFVEPGEQERAREKKELEEYFAAAKKHKTHQKNIELLEYEQEVLEQKIRKEPKVFQNLENLIEQHLPQILEAFPKIAATLSDLQVSLKQKGPILKEMHEAFTLSKKIKKQLEEIAAYLQHSFINDSWGTFENAVPSKPTNKKAPLAKSFKKIEQIQPQYKALQQALKDVNRFRSFSRWDELHDLNCFVKLMITRRNNDFISKSIIKETLDCLNEKLNWLSQLDTNLNRHLIKLDGQGGFLEKKTIELIIKQL